MNHVHTGGQLALSFFMIAACGTFFGIWVGLMASAVSRDDAKFSDSEMATAVMSVIVAIVLLFLVLLFFSVNGWVVAS